MFSFKEVGFSYSFLWKLSDILYAYVILENSQSFCIWDLNVKFQRDSSYVEKVRGIELKIGRNTQTYTTDELFSSVYGCVLNKITCNRCILTPHYWDLRPNRLFLIEQFWYDNLFRCLYIVWAFQDVILKKVQGFKKVWL